MDEQFEIVKSEMEMRRASLTDKLEALEQKVTDSVHEVTAAVTNVKDAVQDTVGSVKDSVEETIVAMKDSVGGTVDAVKEGFQDTMGAVKETFDIPHQVDQHPWPMLAGAFAIGFVTGNLIPTSRSYAAPRSNYGTSNGASRRSSSAERSNGHHSQESPVASAKQMGESLVGKFTHMVEPEINKLKSLAIGAALGAFRDYITKSVPPEIGEHLHELIDNVTTKLGAEPLREPVFSKRM